MKKFTIISLFCLLASVSMWAGPVSKDVALSNAKAFISGTLNNGMRKAPGINRQAQLLTVMEAPEYYVFNVGRNDGFVIVSGSDKTQSILGYSDSGSIDPEHMPEPLKQWFAELPIAVKYQELGLHQVRDLSKAPRKAPKVMAKNPVPVLIPSRWNQGDPYNLFTPEYKDDNGNMQPHSATGCVATAMAQVMYFWKWPQEACKTIPSYSSSWNMQRTLPELEPYTFDWDSMTDTYSSSSSQKSKEAVAMLMKYVGHSIQMGYGPASGAGTGMPPYALKTFYDYDQNLYHAIHDNYTFQEWEDLIYSELAAGRPVLISGDNSDLTGGHEWVCDGYDGNGCFHQNWGWGGMSDGYFVLTVMQPDNQGIGGSTSSDGYSMSHSIVVGLQPSYMAGGEPGTLDERLAITSIKPGKSTYTRKSVDSEFTLTVSYDVKSNLPTQYVFDICFAVIDASGQVVRETTAQKVTIGANSKLTRTQYARFSGLGDGQYSIKARCRVNGTTDWVDLIDGDDYALKAVISNDGLLLNVEPIFEVTSGGYKLQVNEFELVGASAVGSEQKVRVNITNTGGSEYYRNTFLLVDGQWKSGNCIAIPAGHTMDVYFKYKPDALGAHTFVISTEKNTGGRLYSTRLTLEEPEKTTISIRPRLLNKYSGSNLYSNEMRMAVQVINRGSAAYNSWVKLSGWRWTTSGWGYGLSSKYFDVNVPAGKDTTFYVTMSDLEYTSHYGLDFEGNEGVLTRAVKVNLDGPTITRGGIYYWTADGTMEGIAPSTRLAVTSDMVAVALPGVSNIPVITFGDDINPNFILYYEKDADVPSRVLNVMKNGIHNIVFGDEAEDILFTDGHAAFIPKAFTAKKASFVTTPTESWSTLALPFAPQNLTADGSAIDWFHSASDKNKQIVFKEFNALLGTRLYFNYADKLNANRPYLVSYAGSVGGRSFSIVGKEVTMSAEDVDIVPAPFMSTYANDFKFYGTMNGEALPKAYELVNEGSIFYQRPVIETKPFRAYFVANNAGAEEEPALYVVNDNGMTGITEVSSDKAGETVFDLQGRRVNATLNKGIYIRNGKKFVK